jgi:flavin reductase (DIM6/NTAB) family NADH-FMN oxidoreductase RutF
VTIHRDHPFLDPDPDPVRRFRARLGGAVTLWTSGADPDRAGLTVSSLMVAAGDPALVLSLVDPDSDLFDALVESGAAVVQLLRWPHRQLADAFAGAPAPGGPFTLGEWEQTAFGPRLVDVETWAGVRLEKTEPAGWASLVTCVVEEITVSDDDADPLFHRRGRYSH